MLAEVVGERWHQLIQIHQLTDQVAWGVEDLAYILAEVVGERWPAPAADSDSPA